MVRRFLLLAVVAVLAVCGWFYAEYRRTDLETEEITDSVRSEVDGGFIATGLGKTHYELAGPTGGRTVVLVHGFSVPYYLWDGTFEAIRDAGYQVLRYDLYGRGWSDRPNGRYDEPMYRRQLDELLRALRISGKVDLVGASMGGPLVAAFACAYPERVRSVTLLGPGWGRGAELPGHLGWPLWGEYEFAHNILPRLPNAQKADFIHPEQFPDWVDRYRVQMKYKGFRRALLETLRTYVPMDWKPVYACAGSRKIPFLVVWGTKDTDSPFSHSQEVLPELPGARFLPVVGGGHVTYLENPEVVHPALLDFLKQH